MTPEWKNVIELALHFMNCYGPDQNYDLLKGNKRYRAKPNAGHTYEVRTREKQMRYGHEHFLEIYFKIWSLGNTHSLSIISKICGKNSNSY